MHYGFLSKRNCSTIAQCIDWRWRTWMTTLYAIMIAYIPAKGSIGHLHSISPVFRRTVQRNIGLVLTNARFCMYSCSYSRYLKPKWAATRSSTLRRIPMKRSSCSFLLKVAALPRLVSAYTKTQVVFQAGNPNYQMISTQCTHTLHSLKAPLVISSVIFSCNERGRIRCSIYIWTALTLCHCTLEEKTKLHNYYRYIRSSPHTIPYTTS